MIERHTTRDLLDCGAEVWYWQSHQTRKVAKEVNTWLKEKELIVNECQSNSEEIEQTE